jgi:hypothetical protein
MVLGGDGMAKSIKYDCYAYLVIDRPTNTYPIRNPKNHLESIFSLKEGDIIYIKGLGHLRFDGKSVDNYDYVDRGKDGLYQEIALKCYTVQ